MKISKTICDKCKREITEEHPVRIVVQKYGEANRYGVPVKAYKAEDTKHLCPECAKEFEEEYGE